MIQLSPSIIALLATACALPTLPTEWSRGPGVTRGEWVAARYAAIEWCVMTDGECCPRLTAGDGGRHIIAESAEAVDRLLGTRYALGYYAAWTDEGGRYQPEIGFVRQRLIDAEVDIATLLLHEFGHHCAGRTHSDDPDAIMSRELDVYSPTSLTESDYRWFIKHRKEQ